ncbi:hypothetical protein F2Q69_00046318 [Brassica cretica]|uniref:Uncharacterized protein n=1 Tax=Brassica cretica TaxID=69181 RepID=A0A8S9PGG7_BRACR|nr:hypothetical protein F2Q69_00046318 [Brassica cretica]
MASRRYSAAEKGKGTIPQSEQVPKKRVRAPIFDTSALIKDNARTLLEVTDFPPPPKVPITEEVMEELREVTYQYANVADPTESAARCRRVLQSEAKGLMEETAARTVETVSNHLRVYEERNMANASDASFTLNTPTLVGNEEVSQTPAAVRRTRSGTTAFRRTQASPRLFTGTNLRKHNIAQSSQ